MSSSLPMPCFCWEIGIAKVATNMRDAILYANEQKKPKVSFSTINYLFNSYHHFKVINNRGNVFALYTMQEGAKKIIRIYLYIISTFDAKKNNCH